jgi:serine-type D-Ala-D-Ala carboxypeptidase/endopeptidase (penicillin-binding protein 4)
MLDFVAALTLCLRTLGVPMRPSPSLGTPTLISLLASDPKAKVQVEAYLDRLQTAGSAKPEQGIWLQTGTTLLAQHGGDHPHAAASLTKVATSVAALQTWKSDHQFLTLVKATGPVQQGVLQGDLLIQGGGDPLFVWEEGFSLARALNQLGITRVKGNLVIVGNFAMNFQKEPAIAGQHLYQSLNPDLWPEEAKTQFASLPQGTPSARVEVAGSVTTVNPAASSDTVLLITHRSLPLVELLRQLNIYSNNFMAEMLATEIGGAQSVARQAASAAAVPLREVQLVNGSGLGGENRISPRAVCGMFQAIQQRLQPDNLTIADVFPMAGRDRGTVETRKLPASAVVKTGSLWNVSALAGAIPTRKHGTVWFAILNQGENLEGFRQQQDRLLANLTQTWGTAPRLPAEFAYRRNLDFVGNPARNQATTPSP